MPFLYFNNLLYKKAEEKASFLHKRKELQIQEIVV